MTFLKDPLLQNLINLILGIATFLIAAVQTWIAFRTLPRKARKDTTPTTGPLAKDRAWTFNLTIISICLLSITYCLLMAFWAIHTPFPFSVGLSILLSITVLASIRLITVRTLHLIQGTPRIVPLVREMHQSISNQQVQDDHSKHHP